MLHAPRDHLLRACEDRFLSGRLNSSVRCSLTIAVLPTLPAKQRPNFLPHLTALVPAEDLHKVAGRGRRPRAASSKAGSRRPAKLPRRFFAILDGGRRRLKAARWSRPSAWCVQGLRARMTAGSRICAMPRRRPGGQQQRGGVAAVMVAGDIPTTAPSLEVEVEVEVAVVHRIAALPSAWRNRRRRQLLARETVKGGT